MIMVNIFEAKAKLSEVPGPGCPGRAGADLQAQPARCRASCRWVGPHHAPARGSWPRASLGAPVVLRAAAGRPAGWFRGRRTPFRHAAPGRGRLSGRPPQRGRARLRLRLLTTTQPSEREAMKLLLDTCAFLWIVADAPELSPRARAIFQAADNEVYLSAASAWEIAVKHGLAACRCPKRPTASSARCARRTGSPACPSTRSPRSTCAVAGPPPGSFRPHDRQSGHRPRPDHPHARHPDHPSPGPDDLVAPAACARPTLARIA